MRRQIVNGLFFAALFVLLSGASASYADVMNSAPVDNFLKAFNGFSGITSSGGFLYRAADRLFWILAFIQFAWSMGQLGLRGEWTLSSITGVLVREALFIGFFYWLLTWSSSNGLTNMITVGIKNMAKLMSTTYAGGAGWTFESINPTDFFIKCVHIMHSLTDVAFKYGVYGSVWAVVPYALTVVALSFASAFAALYLLEWFLVVPVGIILLGMGGTIWSRKFATNYIRVLISVGFKLLCLQIVLIVASKFLDGIQTNVFGNYNTLISEGFFQHSFNLAGFSAIIFLSVKTIPQFAANLVAGASFERGNWMEPASFPSAPYAAGGGNFSVRGAESYAAESSGMSNSVSIPAPMGIFGANVGGMGGYVPSSRDATESAGEGERTRFQGAGFGNYAHDVVFDEKTGEGGSGSGGGGSIGGISGSGGGFAGGVQGTAGVPGAFGSSGQSGSGGASSMAVSIPGVLGASSVAGGEFGRVSGADTQSAAGVSAQQGASGAGFVPGASALSGTVSGSSDSSASSTPSVSSAPSTDIHTIAGMSSQTGASGSGSVPGASALPGTGTALPGTLSSMRTQGRPDARASGLPDARGESEPIHDGSETEIDNVANAAGLPDARSAVEAPDDRDAGRLPDARSAGRPDARSVNGLPDARSADGMSDARGAASMPDARELAGLPSDRGAAGLADTRPTVGRRGARPSGGRLPDDRPAGLPDAKPSGLPDARPAGGLPDARPEDGLPDARPADGLPDARPAGPAPTSADMRNAVRDGLSGGM